MYRNSCTLAIYSLIIMAGVLLVGSSVTSLAGKPTKVRISEKILTRVHYTNVTFSKALFRLQDKYKLPICTEIPWPVTPPPEFKPRPGFEGKRQKESEENILTISLDLKDKKVGEVLDALMTAMKDKYYWVEDEGVINVIPVKSKGDKSYLLNREVNNLRISSQTPAQALLSLICDVFPEYKWQGISSGQKSIYDVAAEGTVDIDIKKGTMRQALNEIVRKKGYIWQWNPRHKDFGLIGDKFAFAVMSSSKKVQKSHKSKEGK